MTLAEDKLVIVEVYSQDECDVGNPESWGAAPTFNTSSEAHDALMEPCTRLHSTISRVARECGDVRFFFSFCISNHTLKTNKPFFFYSLTTK